ncbi:MAG TPA: class I lanthipeptide [Thermoanaerobaculia bacterium]|nr:class I lanthipeptide [Thermoanaerobaculia bacterium]
MKKKETVRKLTLNKETLRGLEEAEGGAVFSLFPTCWDVGCPVTQDFRC